MQKLVSVSCLAVALWIGFAMGGPPRAQAQGARILPLGDSITHGVAPYPSYRYRLWQKCINAGIPINYVGTRTDNCLGRVTYPPYVGIPFDLHHEGHCGWRLQDLFDDCVPGERCAEPQPNTPYQGNLFQWSTAYTADAALIHIGSNDIYQRTNPWAFLLYAWFLIDALRFDNPNVYIYFAQIMPISGQSTSQVMLLNTLIYVVGTFRNTPQSPIVVVDMYTGFNPSLHMFDGVHPNTIGEEMMAQRWFDALLPALTGN